VRTKCGFYMLGKKKKKKRKKYAREARSVEVCFGAQKQKKHTPPRISLFTSLFDSFCAFVCASELVCFFPFFAYSKKTSFRTRNSSFLKHRIHPKHGSGRTSSLTRSNTRKCISSSFYFVFSFVEFFFKQRAKLSSLFFLSV